MTDTMAAWHSYMASGDPAALSALLDDDVIFESPVVHTPQRGKTITLKYLMAAAKVLGGPRFAYLGENSAILEFETEIESIRINGIDMIWWNAEGRITRFKVMVRPLKAINLVHQMMGGGSPLPDDLRLAYSQRTTRKGSLAPSVSVMVTNSPSRMGCVSRWKMASSSSSPGA
jgi:hypothetical protein